MKFRDGGYAMAVNSTEVLEIESTMQEMADNPGLIKEFIKDITPGIINFGIKLAISILVLVIGFKIIKSIIKFVKKSMNRAGVEAGAASFLCTLIKYVLDFVLIMIVLSSYGLSGSIVAILGSAGLTVGLALQGSLANLAGGVLIVVLKPFRVGDYIIDSGSGKEGTVSEISIFYTKIITPDHKVIMIPNGSLSNATITNVSMQDKRRVDLIVGVSYNSDLALVKDVLREIAIMDSDVLQDEPIDVFVNELAASSVDMGLRVWVEKDNYFPVKWRLTERIKTTFDERAIEIPYPHMNLIVEKNN